MEGYPKFQWSVFVKNGKDQQFVVRADTIEEFKQAKKDVLGLIGETVVTDGVPAQRVNAETPTNTMGINFATTCMTCKKPATQRSGTNKTTGKEWNAIFCSSEDRSHTKWL